ncbi:hypothetical protein RhiirC2_802140, partial [Rhizophagus irregularis]
MLNRLPVEIVERIVAKIPDTDLIAQYEKDNIDWITFEIVLFFYKGWMDYLTENQLYIMEKMLRNGMVVDFQERETIEYALSEQRWGGDPWGLDWEWNEWTQQETLRNNSRSRSRSKSRDQSTSAQRSNSNCPKNNNQNNHTNPSSSGSAGSSSTAHRHTPSTNRKGKDRSVSFSSNARTPLLDPNSSSALEAALNILNVLKSLQHDVAR